MKDWLKSTLPALLVLVAFVAYTELRRPAITPPAPDRIAAGVKGFLRTIEPSLTATANAVRTGAVGNVDKVPEALDQNLGKSRDEMVNAILDQERLGAASDGKIINPVAAADALDRAAKAAHEVIH